MPNGSVAVDRNWPEPDAAAQAHSERLIAQLRETIEGAGGWISFADYMQAALYAPGLGYYSAGSAKFGPAGDFVTAPEISPLFGMCLATQCEDVLHHVRSNTVFEAGSGSGELARAITDISDIAPLSYTLVEVSADLRQRQKIRLGGRSAEQHDVRWLDGPHAIKPFSGVIIANEVLDALPVERFTITNGDVHSIGVSCRDGRFVFATRPGDESLTTAVRKVEAALGRAFSDGFVSEIRPQLPAFIAAWAGKLERGAMIWIDYGCSRREFYAPERHQGTLRCHYRHRAHDDPFVYPGLQDITAWVDFTAVAEAGVDAGLELAGYSTQAHFLLGCGIEQRYDALRRATDDEAEILRLNEQLKRLLLPGEMGERFRVMALTRAMETELIGFSFRDLSASL